MLRSYRIATTLLNRCVVNASNNRISSFIYAGTRTKPTKKLNDRELLQAAVAKLREKLEAESKPLKSDDISRTMVVKVLNETEYIGEMPFSEALVMAKAQKKLIYSSNSKSEVPLVKLSTNAVVQQKIEERVKQEEERLLSIQMEEKNQKELRFKATTQPNDLAIKCRHLDDFLRDKLKVNVLVQFTSPKHWQREEPLRREVLSNIFRHVAESGLGVVELNSIQYGGLSIQCTILPTDIPADKSLWEKAMRKLTVPMELGKKGSAMVSINVDEYEKSLEATPTVDSAAMEEKLKAILRASSDTSVRRSTEPVSVMDLQNRSFAEALSTGIFDTNKRKRKAKTFSNS